MKIIAFDFDGVIAEYDGWKGEDIFGEPIKETIKVMIDLYIKDFSIIIWTCRRDTPALRNWLHKNHVPFDSINSISHNPPGTSGKPAYDVLVDDRAINFKPGINLLETINEVLIRKESVLKVL